MVDGTIGGRRCRGKRRRRSSAVDLDKLEAALNETSRRAAAQWLGFLSFWAYLFFTTVAVTHYDLLAETPVKLLLIGVELGLSFFSSRPRLYSWWSISTSPARWRRVALLDPGENRGPPYRTRC